MHEGYFLYYEEVDWARRRGPLPLKLVPEAEVLHRGGATIGSGTYGRTPSALAYYFNYRGRLRFLRRFSPASLPVAYLHGIAKAAQLFIGGFRAEGRAVLGGLFGVLVPAEVNELLQSTAAPERSES